MGNSREKAYIIKKIKNPALTDAHFILAPKPLQDETLTSWLVRTAFAHTTYPMTFINLHRLGANIHYSFDMDIHIKKGMLQALEFKSGITYDALFALTLQSYGGYLFEGEHCNTYMPPLVNSIKKDRKSNGLKFCPACFQQDSIPYWRKIWRVDFYNICEQHKVFLLDGCPQCGTNIKMLYMKNPEGVTFCHKCGFDLRNSEHQKIGNEYLHALNAQKYFTKILSAGTVNICGMTAYSCAYFKIFEKLHTLLKRHHDKGLDGFFYKAKLRDIFQQKTSLLSRGLVSIKYSLLDYLLKDFPVNFLIYISTNKIMRWQLIKDMRYVPFFYQEFLDAHIPKLSMRGKEITKEEISNAVKYLLRRQMPTTKANLTRLLGCDLFHNKFFKANLELCGINKFCTQTVCYLIASLG